jgi:uroporphyrin-III C-methyltransferase/precorrin-2 dehydrogenase/sirohydrochlorin ferrochelatase
MSLFPLFLKLDGRSVLLVGAGTVAESKIKGLLAAGAKVTVVAPVATAAIKSLAAGGSLTWHGRPFMPADLDGVTLVVAAVPREAAAPIYQEARRRNILVNSVDDPEHCDFYYPAVVERGDFQIAISTAGRSPALAQKVRMQLERQFGPEYASWVDQLGTARRELFATDIDAGERTRMLHAMADERPTTAAPVHRTSGIVYLVGAGPGDPELLTLKALRIIGEAEVVLHDDLLTPDILELIPSHAQVEGVGKRHGDVQITQQDINRRLVRYGSEGKTVVRLKGGDGAIFGRASEEIEALSAAGIPFVIVPGVTAASGAAAAAGVSLTDRRAGSSLIFLTAQRCKGNPPPNWKAIAELGGAMAIYMPGGHEADLAAQLMNAGLAPHTPCFAVGSASRAEEQVIETTLAGLSTLGRLGAPALLLVGVLAPQSAGAGSLKSLMNR